MPFLAVCIASTAWATPYTENVQAPTSLPLPTEYPAAGGFDNNDINLFINGFDVGSWSGIQTEITSTNSNNRSVG